MPKYHQLNSFFNFPLTYVEKANPLISNSPFLLATYLRRLFNIGYQGQPNLVNYRRTVLDRETKKPLEVITLLDSEAHIRFFDEDDIVGDSDIVEIQIISVEQAMIVTEQFKHDFNVHVVISKETNEILGYRVITTGFNNKITIYDYELGGKN